MKIKVHTLCSDTDNGTHCQVFATEDELHDAMQEIIQPDPPEEDRSDDSVMLRGLLDVGLIREAWDWWEDNRRDPMDTYAIDEHEIEVDLTLNPQT